MKILIAILVILISSCSSGACEAAHAQIQKYVIDGKTYYGDPPPIKDYEKITESESISLSNTYVDDADRARADHRLKDANEQWAQDIKGIDERNEEVRKESDRVSGERRKEGDRAESKKQSKKDNRKWKKRENFRKKTQ